MTRVTVGIPFYNEERNLADAVRSILHQTSNDMEVLLVDDGSTDGSLAIARSFTDPRVTVISDGRRRHLPARLNEIVQRARTPLVARMDADDVSHPMRLARQLEAFDAEARCDVVGTWAALADDGGPFAMIENGQLPPTTATALAEDVLAHATLLGRRAWFLENPYDEALTRSEDRDFWCRTAESACVRVVRDCLYVVRVEPRVAGFFEDYAEAQRQLRVLYLRYGPRSLGWATTARLVGQTFAKSALMAAMVRTGTAERLVRRRGRPLTAEEKERALEALGAAQRA